MCVCLCVCTCAAQYASYSLTNVTVRIAAQSLFFKNFFFFFYFGFFFLRKHTVSSNIFRLEITWIWLNKNSNFTNPKKSQLHFIQWTTCHSFKLASDTLCRTISSAYSSFPFLHSHSSINFSVLTLLICRTNINR